MDTINLLIANPEIVLREESDEWALLFEPDSGNTYGLSPEGVHIWKCLDGKHAIEDICNEMRSKFSGAPDDLYEHVQTFVDALIKKGLAGQCMN